MDLQFLRPLYGDFGGYVSVFLDTSPAGGMAASPSTCAGGPRGAGWPAPGPTARHWTRWPP